ncbi:MAG: energy transducer TonB [Pseudomonadales bacterium]|nr:energy transducer TonB [Pseudomonadales bacterium]
MLAMSPVSEAYSTPGIGSSDRMGFTLFMAILLHLVIILGVGFELMERQLPAASLEITLAQYQSTKAPEDADFLAQANQQGSGTAEQKMVQTTPIESQRPQNQVSHVQEQVKPKAAPKKGNAKTVVVAKQSARKSSRTKTNSDLDTPLKREISLLEKSLEIASLEAQLDQQTQFNAKMPRVRTVNAVSTRYSVDAYYMDGWRRKIEVIGNLNYPKEARRQNLFGSLRMLVALLPDGTIKEVRILKSSGTKLLDDSAVRIVRLAAPFAPFPDDLRREVDVLQIIRTWKFQKNQYFSGS